MMAQKLYPFLLWRYKVNINKMEF